MRLALVTVHTEEPISLDQAKNHLRETGTEQDDRIDALIKAARLEYQSYTQRILMSSTWDLYLDGFPGETYIELPGPVSAVTSVTYQNSSDAPIVFSSTTGWDKDMVSEPARVYLRYGQSWPTTYAEPNAVVVRFISGYANADAVPESIKNGMYLYISHMYENREPMITGMSNIAAPVNPWQACWGNEARFPI